MLNMSEHEKNGKEPVAESDRSLLLGGANSVLPEGDRRWNWGAFFLGWIWGATHGVWISFFTMIPIFGFFFRFYLGAEGNELAWKSGYWKSIDGFHQAQRNWAIAGIVAFLISILLIALSLAITSLDSTLAPEQEIISGQEIVSKHGNYITLDPQPSTYNSAPIKFSGRVAANTESVLVIAKYGSKVDRYFLENFTPGDLSFKYQAAEKYNNLADGKNVYTFVAYGKDGATSQVVRTIYYSQPVE